MSRSRRLVPFLLSLSLLAAGPAAAYQDSETPSEAAVSLDLLALDDEQVERLSPLLRDLRGALVEERDALRDLEAAVRAEEDPARGVELQRRIHAVKAATERELIRIQANHARQAGRRELADRLESALRALQERDAGLPTPAEPR